MPAVCVRLHFRAPKPGSGGSGRCGYGRSALIISMRFYNSIKSVLLAHLVDGFGRVGRDQHTALKCCTPLFWSLRRSVVRRIQCRYRPSDEGVFDTSENLKPIIIHPQTPSLDPRRGWHG